MCRIIVVVSVLALAAGTARGEEPAAPEGSRAQCRYLHANAAGERALSLAPQAFGRAGIVPASEREQGADPFDLDPTWRLTFGLEYSLSGAWRGHLLGREADADCRLARAQEAVDAELRAGGDVGRVAALRAKQEVLERALPAAEARLAGVRELVADGVLTDQDLVAVEAEVERLRATRHAAVREREAIEADQWQVAPSDRRVSELVGELTAAELALEQVHGDQRSAKAWSLSVAAGVDAVEHDGFRAAPFGLVRFSLNLGYLWQDGATRRARGALAERSSTDQRAAAATSARLRTGLERAHASARSELAERRAFLAGINERSQLLSQVDTARSRLHQDVLWFTGIRTEAEIAYLAAFSAELEGYARDAFSAEELRDTSFAARAGQGPDV
jgi:hypothetical protein